MIIYSSQGVERARVHQYEYNGAWMGDRAIELKVSSAEPIAWEVGDWCDYRGERFALSVLPAVVRRARDYSDGAAVQYTLRMIPMAQMLLQDIMMCDLVLGDNNLHYTGMTNFSFYADESEASGADVHYSVGIKAFADRVRANLEKRYGEGTWVVSIEPYTYINGDQSVGISDTSVWGALGSVCGSLDVAFDARVTVANGSIVSRSVVFSPKTIDARVRIGYYWQYGKGYGLTGVERNVDENQQIVTRLFAVGSERNLPYRYYNYLWYREEDGVRKFVVHRLNYDTEDAEATYWIDDNGLKWNRVINSGMYVPRLMLPSFRQAGNVNYIDADTINVLGVKEGYKAFDQEDVQDEYSADIYPSIEDVTYGEVYDSMSAEERAAQRMNLSIDGSYPQRATRLDAIISAQQVDWSGIIPEGQDNSKWFTVRIANLGFDINEMLVDGDTPRLSMKSGMCCGREFEILSCKAYDTSRASVPIRYYDLTLSAAQDETIGQYFPNSNFQIAADDRFVILGIEMHDIYVRSGEQRLLNAAEAWLADNDYTRYTYVPKIDNIFMARRPDIASMLREGVVMELVDESLDIDHVRRIITQLKISEGKAEIPLYEVTIAEDQEPSLAQRVTNEVSTALYGRYGYSGGGSSVVDTGEYLRKDKSDHTIGSLTIDGGVVTDVIRSNKYTNGSGFYLWEHGLRIKKPSDTAVADANIAKVEENITTRDAVAVATERATTTLSGITMTGFVSLAGLLQVGASGASLFTIRSRKIVITNVADASDVQEFDLATSMENEKISSKAIVRSGQTYTIEHVITFGKVGQASAGFTLGVCGVTYDTGTLQESLSDTKATVHSTEQESIAMAEILPDTINLGKLRLKGATGEIWWYDDATGEWKIY